MLGSSLTLTKHHEFVQPSHPASQEGQQKDPTQPQGTREDLTCYRAQASALETS